MRVMSSRARHLAIALTAALAATACAGGGLPQPNQMAADAGRLDALVPLLEELEVTGFEASPYCLNLEYARGAFGHLGQDGCARTGTVEFDAPALADHTRLAAAIDATGVATDRLRVATYAADGDLQTAWFALAEASISDNGDYLYDPTGAEPKQDVPDLRDLHPHRRCVVVRVVARRLIPTGTEPWCGSGVDGGQ